MATSGTLRRSTDELRGDKSARGRTADRLRRDESTRLRSEDGLRRDESTRLRSEDGLRRDERRGRDVGDAHRADPCPRHDDAGVVRRHERARPGGQDAVRGLKDALARAADTPRPAQRSRRAIERLGRRASPQPLSRRRATWLAREPTPADVKMLKRTEESARCERGTPVASPDTMLARMAALGLLCAALGCRGYATYTAPSGAVTQFGSEFTLSPVRRVLVVAVDDEATADAATIRSATAARLRPTMKHEVADGAADLDSDWLRADLRVVIVHPSIAGSARAIGPSDDPNLAVVTDNASLGDIDALADAAARAVDAFVAPAGGRYSLLEATARTVELLARARAPEDAREASLLASLGKPEMVAVVLGTSRDDDSAEGVAAYAWWRPPLPFFIDFGVTLSPLQGPDVCSRTLEPSTRLGAWSAEAGEAMHRFTVLNPACAAETSGTETSGFDGIIPDRWPICLPATPATRPEGEAACRVRVTTAETVPCSTDPGMLDPLDPDGVRRPRTEAAEDGTLLRVCDVHELAGAQAGTCSKTTTTCTGCAPGWCVADIGSPFCPTGTFRFVHGAAPRSRATVDYLCDVAQ